MDALFTAMEDGEEFDLFNVEVSDRVQQRFGFRLAWGTKQDATAEYRALGQQRAASRPGPVPETRMTNGAPEAREYL